MPDEGKHRQPCLKASAQAWKKGLDRDWRAVVGFRDVRLRQPVVSILTIIETLFIFSIKHDLETRGPFTQRNLT